MTRTPWGEAGKLKERRLPPGPATAPEIVDRNQRERLFAALVASVEERGFERTRVEDLVELSGVSRRDFYRRFADKQACLVEAAEELFGLALDEAERAGRRADGDARGRAREALEAVLRAAAAQPAAARLCLCEIYAGGEEALAVVEAVGRRCAAYLGELLEAMPGHAGMAEKMVAAIIGGLHKVMQTRLHRGEEAQLPGMTEEILAWGLGYVAPPRELRTPRRRKAAPVARGAEAPERLLRALAEIVAEKGYPRTTVAGIARRAGASQRTFYQHFNGREEAMVAAFDRGATEMVAAILPEFRRARDWPEAVRLGMAAMFGFAAREPEYALLGTVGAYAAGKRALEQRDQVMAGLEALLMPGYEVEPRAPAIAAEAIGGALYALTYEQLQSEGPESLAGAAPLGTYLALAPFLGAEEACEVANGGVRRGGTGAGVE